jgi:hypothetical protein
MNSPQIITLAHWWKYPNSFLKLVMNTGKTTEVHREDINNDILESLVARWDRIGNPDITVALPFPGDYGINAACGPGTADFAITKGELPLSYGYFSSEYDDDESAWGCVEYHYLESTGKSGMEPHLPAKPETKPFLAVIRLQGDLRCDCEACKESRPREPDAALEHSWAWVEEVESALAYLLLKEGFPKELYEHEF